MRLRAESTLLPVSEGVDMPSSGVLVSDHAGSFTYADESPNGLACGPTCRQAALN